MESIDENFLNETIEKYKGLTTSIESLIALNNLVEAQNLISQFEKEMKNSALFSYKAILSFQNGDIDQAIKILKEGVQKHPFSFNLYFNLGFMNETIQQFGSSIESYFFAVKYSQSDEEKKEALEGIQKVSKTALKAGQSLTSIQEEIKRHEKLLQQYDARIYPIDINGASMIRRPQNVDTSEEYMVNLYKELSFEDIDLQSRMLFKSELIKGSVLRERRTWKTTGPVVIPISKIDNNVAIKFVVNGKEFNFTVDALPMNQFHYIRISEIGILEIYSKASIFVGNPIALNQKKKPVKLVLKIFVDGLSYRFLEDCSLEKTMPFTYNFFKEGLISTNCYPTSEWTLPSKASINTGNYATKHSMLQPDSFFRFHDSEKLLAEYFQEQGYYCTNIATNWRTTPNLGYHRGFDRMIYQNFLGSMDGKQVVMETIEHLMAFNQTNNFMTISLMDLHNVPDGVENHLRSQVNTDITNRIYENEIGSTSVQTKYDKSKIAKYREEIKRVDGILSVLYDFILKNYNRDEFVITFHSDHGQSFLEQEFNLLSDSRLKIPFMMRGRNIPTEICNELVESVDILPSILSSCEIYSFNKMDGKLPKCLGGIRERDFTFTQIIHPNQPYKARINEVKLSYYIETKYLVKSDLTIYLDGYHSFILDNDSGKDITAMNLEKKASYDQFIFNEIKDMLRWSN